MRKLKYIPYCEIYLIVTSNKFRKEWIMQHQIKVKENDGLHYERYKITAKIVPFKYVSLVNDSCSSQ